MSELVETRVSVCKTELTCLLKVLRHLIAEDLQSTLNTGARCDSSLSRTSEVRVIEVDEAVDPCAHLTALAHLVPRLCRARGTHRQQHGANRIGITNDNPRNPADLARLRLNTDATCRTNKRHPGFTGRTCHLERGGTTWLGQRSGCEERTAPDRRQIIGVARCQAIRQPSNGATAHIEQPRLAGKRFAPLDNADREPFGITRTGCLDMRQLGANTINFGDIASRSHGQTTIIDLCFDGDASGDRVQATSESQKSSRLSHTHRWSRVANGDEFCLHLGGQSHGSPYSKSHVTPRVQKRERALNTTVRPREKP